MQEKYPQDKKKLFGVTIIYTVTDWEFYMLRQIV